MARTRLNKPIMLYLTEDMDLDVRVYSERMFTTKSQFIRDAIDHYLDGMGLTPGASTDHATDE